MRQNAMKRVRSAAPVALILGTCLIACAGLPGLGSTSWKEEALLHDGRKVIVSRTVERGGRHEIGQQPPVKAETLVLALPATGQVVSWKTEYSQDVGFADFMPLLLDIVDGTAYLITSTVGCLSFNKWGRPNPPYITLKHEDKAWKRIPLQEVPAAISLPNLIISSPDNKVKQIGKSFVTAGDVKSINSTLTQPEYKNIMRDPISTEKINAMCEERVFYKGYWILPNDPVARGIIDSKHP